METYDLIMLVVAGGAVLFGFLKGFAWQLASLASLIVSYLLAYRFADQLAPHLNADPRWSKYLAMLVIYIGTSFAVWMMFRFVSSTIDRVRLREFDRQMGGLFGLAKGVLLCLVVTFFAVTLSEQSRGAVLKSKSGVYISEFLNKATPIMPPELAQLLGPYLDRLNRGLDPMQTVEHPQIPTTEGFQQNLQQQLQQQMQGVQQQLPPGYMQNVPGGYQQQMQSGYQPGMSTGYQAAPAGGYQQPPYSSQPQYPYGQPAPAYAPGYQPR